MPRLPPGARSGSANRRTTARALHAVHQRGFVHRDVKPHNVLLWGASTDDEHAMLTDFGIAKALDESRSLTNFGIVGTPGYMAPEIWNGAPATPASDQYSAAVMAYEMLSGEHPLEHGDGDWRKAHLERLPRPLADLAPQLDRSVPSQQPGERWGGRSLRFDLTSRS
jgi:serine/threonine protein kinase